MKQTPIIILHGWGKDVSGARFHEIKSILESKKYTVYSPDLPGFGSNPLKKEELFFEDYVSFVHHYIVTVLKETKQKKVILIGHSFGGRVGIRVTATYPELIEKLVLTGASGIPRPLPSVKKKLAYALTKVLKPIFLIPPFSIFYKFFRKLIYYSIGEMDYYKAGNLTQTFKNVYKASIADDLVKIAIPTVLIWGANDTFVPLKDGEYMHEYITGSKLIIVPNTGHRLPYDNPQEFAQALLPVLE